RRTSEIGELDQDTAPDSVLAKLLERAVVSRVRRYQLVARTQQLQQGHVDRQPGGEGECADAPLELGDTALEHSAIGGAFARVAIAAWVRSVRVPLEGRREIDGLGHRSRGGIGS